MAELLLVPEVAAGATEVVLSEWLVRPGQEFRTGDPIAVIETDKAVVEIEAELDATLLTPLAAAGAEVGVGRPIAILGTPDEASVDMDSLLASVDIVAGPVGAAPVRRDASTLAKPPILRPDPAGKAGRPPATGPGRRFASPLARALLRDAGLSVDGPGTGPNGRIIRRDVEAMIAGRNEATGPTPAIPHTRPRRAAATRRRPGTNEIPYFYVKRSARVDALLALSAEVNAHLPVTISVTDFVLRAVAVAYGRVPEANVSWTDQTRRRFDTVDVCVAIDSDRGLVTPVVRGVEARSLGWVSGEVRRLAAAAHAGRLRPAELEGGSISVTNRDLFGVEEVAAIIKPPQSAALAVGAAVPAARVVDGETAVVTAMNLVLSVDRRAIDGALAATWMAALVDALEDPLRLLV